MYAWVKQGKNKYRIHVFKTISMLLLFYNVLDIPVIIGSRGCLQQHAFKKCFQYILAISFTKTSNENVFLI